MERGGHGSHRHPGPTGLWEPRAAPAGLLKAPSAAIESWFWHMMNVPSLGGWDEAVGFQEWEGSTCSGHVLSPGEG